MAATPSSGRRSLNTRGTSSRKGANNIPNSEPPLKKRRYVPGGPGGGGRYIDSDGNETPVGGGGPGGHNYSSPRRRPARDNTSHDVRPLTYSPRPRRESRRERAPARPRFSSAAAAAAAVVHGDGFKPREERGWEEFHQDLDIEARFPIFSSWDVDGIPKPTSDSVLNTPNGKEHGKPTSNDDANNHVNGNGRRTPSPHDDGSHAGSPVPDTGARRRSGRPIRRTDSMLKGIGTPEVPKVIPLPGFNPREKLMLPKPSFRAVDPFEKFEEKGINRLNYVDKTMANIGYQESEIFLRQEHNLIRVTEGNIEDDLDVSQSRKSDGDANGSSSLGRVEYDMDEQDTYWLEVINEQRRQEQFPPIKPAIFEATMTKIEKEWYALEKRIPKPNPKPPQTQRPRSSSAAAVNGELAPPGEEQDTKCAICDDGDCENTNAIVFCDGCDLAVHQECYGVPFIPEGQWLCRKCQLIGRGTPTCIFCPNTDGAFKQTNASRWSHLLCAIWIPEVSIGNTTFMEPVMDVEKVPKPRWKLTCYICRQKMGACIQCGNKNCYVAFHVTCARRARLFLKMKSTHGGPASLDASVLKAYCDKHVPADWRREQDVDRAFKDATDHYRRTMRGVLWADSQQSALTIVPAPQDPFAAEAVDDSSNAKITLKLSANGRSKNQPPKIVWRLPSGAPVIPQTVYNSVEVALGRSAVSKRKEFAADMCKYWTLKREARRGAALLKRLQLQMETFTSTEITRRNFAGMGAAGGVRLQRRIDFADSLLEDVDRLRQISAQIKERELQKVEDAYLLSGLVDTIYFPLLSLLRPILHRARSLDSKGVFEKRFNKIYDKLKQRLYTCVKDFSTDLLGVLSDAINLPTGPENTEVATMDDDATNSTLSHDSKQKKALAKRIARAVQPALDDAAAKENDLQSNEQELRRWNRHLKQVADGKIRPNGTNEHNEHGHQDLVNGHNPKDASQHALTNGNLDDDIDPLIADLSNKGSKVSPSSKANKKSARHQNTSNPVPLTNGFRNDADADENDRADDGNGLYMSSPSFSSDTNVPNPGGVPWYMEAFNPTGTTVFEEEGIAASSVLSGSDDLSDMDEDTVSQLVSEKVASNDSPPSSRKPRPSRSGSTSSKLTRSALRRKKRAR